MKDERKQFETPHGVIVRVTRWINTARLDEYLPPEISIKGRFFRRLDEPMNTAEARAFAAALDAAIRQAEAWESEAADSGEGKR